MLLIIAEEAIKIGGNRVLVFGLGILDLFRA
jgi:hypothetical protein